MTKPAIGTDPDQIPVNGLLGSAAFVDIEQLPVSESQSSVLNTKQDTLVSGTNIKTVNGNTLLGSGDVGLEDVLPVFAGQAGKALTVLPGEDGVEWGVAVASGYQEFTVSGTWTKPADATWVYVEAIGGGGGGGISNSTNLAGGGSGGEFSNRLMRAQDVTASVVVTVGSGGNAKANLSEHGSDGGDSSFGAYNVGLGGTGGRYSASTTVGSFALPRSCLPRNAVTSNTQFAYSGVFAGYGASGRSSSSDAGCNSIYGGAGGGSPYTTSLGGVSTHAGNGGYYLFSDPLKMNGAFPGGGGAGRMDSTNAETLSGAGGDGVVRVWWW